jgi:hypothetical protein
VTPRFVWECELGKGKGPNTSFTYTGACKRDVTYTLSVTETDAAGNAANVGLGLTTISGPVAPPNRTANVPVVVAPDPAARVLQWRKVPLADHYVVHLRKGLGEGDYSVTQAAGDPFLSVGLAARSDYTWSITSYNLKGAIIDESPLYSFSTVIGKF